MPLSPNRLKGSKWEENLLEWFSGQNLSIDPDGAVHVELGPNVRLERVSKYKARAYKVHEVN